MSSLHSQSPACPSQNILFLIALATNPRHYGLSIFLLLVVSLVGLAVLGPLIVIRNSGSDSLP